MARVTTNLNQCCNLRASQLRCCGSFFWKLVLLYPPLHCEFKRIFPNLSSFVLEISKQTFVLYRPCALFCSEWSAFAHALIASGHDFQTSSVQDPSRETRKNPKFGSNYLHTLCTETQLSRILPSSVSCFQEQREVHTGVRFLLPFLRPFRFPFCDSSVLLCCCAILPLK